MADEEKRERRGHYEHGITHYIVSGYGAGGSRIPQYGLVWVWDEPDPNVKVRCQCWYCGGVSPDGHRDNCKYL